MKNFLLTASLLFVCPALAAPFDYRYSKNWKYVYHKHNESSFQHAHCSALNGIEEYKLDDKTRVDCLTDKYAIEYDFADKEYEAVGQVLHYAVRTSRRPKIVLILDKDKENQQMIYYKRTKETGDNYNFDVEYITDEILNVDKKGRCHYKKCKCNRKKQ